MEFGSYPRGDGVFGGMSAAIDAHHGVCGQMESDSYLAGDYAFGMLEAMDAHHGVCGRMESDSNLAGDYELGGMLDDMNQLETTNLRRRMDAFNATMKQNVQAFQQKRAALQKESEAINGRVKQNVEEFEQRSAALNKEFDAMQFKFDVLPEGMRQGLCKSGGAGQTAGEPLYNALKAHTFSLADPALPQPRASAAAPLGPAPPPLPPSLAMREKAKVRENAMRAEDMSRAAAVGNRHFQGTSNGPRPNQGRDSNPYGASTPVPPEPPATSYLQALHGAGTGEDEQRKSRALLADQKAGVAFKDAVSGRRCRVPQSGAARAAMVKGEFHNPYAVAW